MYLFTGADRSVVLYEEMMVSERLVKARGRAATLPWEIESRALSWR